MLELANSPREDRAFVYDGIFKQNALHAIASTGVTLCLEIFKSHPVTD
jgi:hypothetical protein